ncbi:retrovirus-related pol polyprotein from transposon TNT 1-94 [Tanacetum coccineum]|uniref:Retrovirus-related pol polyprotein from transposon TNT 1-94 n=1 Tax=Tanacetum coccineum TaxID=301880 RepID=A0ABQ4X4E5_9ASTR
MNYLKEQTDGEAMINSIKNDEHPFPVVAQVSLAGTASNAHPTLKDPKFWTVEEKKTRKIDRLARSLLIQGLPNDICYLIDSNDTAKDLWDALERRMLGFEYGEQDRKAVILYDYETFRATEGEKLLDTYLRYLQQSATRMKQYGTLMRQTNNLMDINIDTLYNILKQNKGDMNDAMGYKKKGVMVTSDPLALVAEKTKVSKQREKVIVQSNSEGSVDEDISDLKKITALLAKAFNQKKYYAKPTNNNLRTSSASSSANKKPEYVKSEEKKEDKKADEKKPVKDYNYYKTKMLLAKKDDDEQVLLAEDQAWMESSSDLDQEINANMVFMVKMEKILLDSEESSSTAEETIAEASYYSFDSKSESEYETLEYYDNATNYGLFVDNNDDQEIFHDAIKSASENFNENHIVSQKDHDESEVNHNDSEEKDHLVIKLIKKFNQKISKCQKHIEKANQQSKDLEIQNKDLQDKYDVLKNQVNTFEEKNNEFNEQINVLNEKNDDLLAQTEVLQEELKVKHVVIDIHTECQAQYAKHEEERYQYMIRYYALCDKDKQHRKKIDDQEILFDKISHQLVKMNNNVLRLQEKILEKQTKISKLEECVHNKGFKNEAELERLMNLNQNFHKNQQTHVATIHMIMPSKDKMYNGRKGIGYPLMFLTHSDEALETDKFKTTRENKIEFAYDYGNLNERYQTSSLKPYVPTVILEKIIIDLEDEVIIHICLWIIVLFLTNFVEKFLGTVRFGNNDFAVIAGYGDVVIGSMTIKKVYYVEGVRTDNGTEFKNKTLVKFFDEVRITQQFSAARMPQQNGVVESRNRILVEAARTMLIFANLLLFLWAEAIATACFTQNRSIIHKSFDKTPYELINKRKPNIKFFHVFGCRCYLLNDYDDVGKLNAKGDIRVFVGYSKESAAFRIYNKRTRKIHESVNVNFDEISEMASKQFSLEHRLSNFSETGKSSNLTITKSPTTNVETSNDEIPLHEEEVFMRVLNQFPPTNTQSVSNESVPDVNEASTSHNVFNELLEDAYFDASTTFRDPSNVHTFYQPYPHDKKWTKDHPLHKIIGDPKSSVRTRGQIANSCLFSCMLSGIELANVAKALKDANWVSARGGNL